MIVENILKCIALLKVDGNNTKKQVLDILTSTIEKISLDPHEDEGIINKFKFNRFNCDWTVIRTRTSVRVLLNLYELHYIRFLTEEESKRVYFEMIKGIVETESCYKTIEWPMFRLNGGVR